MEERGEIRDIVEYLGEFLIDKRFKCLFLFFWDNNQPAIGIVCGIYCMQAGSKVEEFNEGNCLVFNLQFAVKKFMHEPQNGDCRGR